MNDTLRYILEQLTDILFVFPAILLALSVHESGHALVAHWLGDDTAYNQGRVTLNPFKHLDPIGTIFLLVFRFGWAKPVSVNPMNFKNRKGGMIATSLAGPGANLLTAFVFFILYDKVYYRILDHFYTGEGFNGVVFHVLTMLLVYTVMININLAIFNLIPISPLDGSKVLAALLPSRIYFNYVLRYERYGSFILIALVMFGALNGFLTTLNGAVTSAMAWLVDLLPF